MYQDDLNKQFLFIEEENIHFLNNYISINQKLVQIEGIPPLLKDLYSHVYFIFKTEINAFCAIKHSYELRNLDCVIRIDRELIYIDHRTAQRERFLFHVTKYLRAKNNIIRWLKK